MKKEKKKWAALIGVITFLIIIAYIFMVFKLLLTIQQEVASENQYSCMQIFNIQNNTSVLNTTYERCCNTRNQSDCFVQPFFH